MSDAINVPYPRPQVDPYEAGLILAYCPQDGELAQWSRMLNRAAATGAGWDLTIRTACPLVGPGGGVYSVDNSGNYWDLAITPPSIGQGWSYSMLAEYAANPTALRTMAYYGWNGGSGDGAGFLVDVGGVRPTYNTGGAVIVMPSYAGRGRVLYVLTNDGVNQQAYANGRYVAQGALPAVLALNRTGRLGGHGEQLCTKGYNFLLTATQIREKYVRDFARQVVYSWHPQDVGEGPAGGIATGAVGEGDWYAPLGGANFRFVYVRDPRLPRGQLALNETGAAVASRLEFAHGRRPSFGSWRSGFLARTLTANPVIYLAPMRGTTYNAAASGCYWWQTSVVGGYWSLSIYRENAAVLCTYVNTSAPAQVGDVVEPSVTRAVDGTWRPWLAVNGATAGTQTTAVDVTYLWNEQIGVVPFAGYVLGLTKNQSEMEPGEFPMPIWMLR